MPRKKKLSLTEVNELLAAYESQQLQLDFQQSQIQGVIADLKKDQAALAKKEGATKAAPAKRRGRPAGKRKATKTTAKAAPKAAAKKRTTAKKATAKKATAKKPGRKPGRPAGSKNKATAAKATATKTAAKSAAPKAKRATKAKTTAKRAPKASAKKAAASGGYRLSPWDQVLLDALKASSKPMRKSDLDDLFKGHPLAKKAKMDADAIYSKVSRVLHKLANKRGAVKKVPTEGKGFAYTMA